MDVETTIEASPPDWRPRVPSPIAGSKLPEPILGDQEGAVEWHDRTHGSRMFVRMDTYDDLRNPRAHFLFGRRGTGKTTYLRMLEHEIESGKVSHYSTSCILDSQPLLVGMSAQVRTSPLAALPDHELAEALIPVWTWIISVAAMRTAVDSLPRRASEPIEVTRLRVFLDTALGPSSEQLKFDRLRERMHELLVVALGRGEWTTDSGEVINNINRVFADQTFLDATDLLAQMATSRPCLVMLDAGDVYAVMDAVPNASITALIASITRLSIGINRQRIYAKAAFPSEILPHIYAYNRGKMQNHIVVISWTYRDLVTLLAKRFAALSGPTEFDDSSLRETAPAHDLIYTTLPATIKTRVGIPFDTLAYIIRHTQRTPRQVMTLVNSVLTHSKASGWRPGTRISDDQLVIHGVHLYLGHLVNDSIDMHRSIYQRLDDVIQGTLSRRSCYFKASALGKFAREVSELRRSTGSNRVDVIRMLFQVGVIGIAHEMHRISQELPERFILEALYEYQIKDTLVASPDSYCVVHPMFYEWLGTKVDAGKFVYPVAFEAEEADVLRKYGVRPTS